MIETVIKIIRLYDRHCPQEYQGNMIETFIKKGNMIETVIKNTKVI